MKKSQRCDHLPLAFILKAILYGCILGFLVVAITLLLFAFLTLLIGFETSTTNIFIIVTLAISSFLASYYSAKKIKQKGLIIGITSGAVFFLIINLIGIIAPISTNSNNHMQKLLVTLIFAAVGGVIAVNKKNKI